MFWASIDICEIAVSSPGNADLLPCFFSMVNDHHLAPALPCLDGTHQSRSPCAYNNDIPFNQMICHRIILQDIEPYKSNCKKLQTSAITPASSQKAAHD